VTSRVRSFRAASRPAGVKLLRLALAYSPRQDAAELGGHAVGGISAQVPKDIVDKVSAVEKRIAAGGLVDIPTIIR
jgi:hypothetical protein